jgi:hypothetical protein
MIWYEYHKIWRGWNYYSEQVYFVCSVQIFRFMVFVTVLGFKFTLTCLLLSHFLFVKKVKFDVYFIVLCIKTVELE